MYKISGAQLDISNRSVPIYKHVDVLVCGGGVAGIAAAIAAARAGAKTLLIERAGFLGGTATGSAMGLIVVPASELTGFPREFFSRLTEEQGAGLGEVVPWDIEAYKLTAMDMLLESGAEPLLYTTVSEPLVRERQMEGVIVDNKSGRQAILAKVVIDTTGDGDVAARAGLPFVKGREEDGAMRPATVMGRIGNIDLHRLKAYIDAHPEDFSRDDGRRVVDIEAGIVRIDGFFSIVEKAKQTGLLDAQAPVNYLRFSGVNRRELADRALLICNSTRIYHVDGTNAADITRAEIEGRRQLRQIVRVCRELLPGFEQSFLIDTSAYLGIRETRRIQGRTMLTYADIAEGERFADSVAVMTSVDYGTAEIHGPDHGHEGSTEDVWARKLALKLMRFEFPLGCMLPVGMSRLVVAGRCASFTHDVDKFARNMAPIGLMGQAAGVFAAIMARDADADWNKLPVAAVRTRLQQDGLAVSLPPGAPHRAIDKIAQ
ncbi:MAG TPA: FAD-dependent oxidoreductase [Burkholderiales bacterium]|nr:FAD-dependent oxidoreductase [Burkholderiales bacterium]